MYLLWYGVVFEWKKKKTGVSSACIYSFVWVIIHYVVMKMGFNLSRRRLLSVCQMMEIRYCAQEIHLDTFFLRYFSLSLILSVVLLLLLLSLLFFWSDQILLSFESHQLCIEYLLPKWLGENNFDDWPWCHIWWVSNSWNTEIFSLNFTLG